MRSITPVYRDELLKISGFYQGQRMTTQSLKALIERYQARLEASYTISTSGTAGLLTIALRSSPKEALRSLHRNENCRSHSMV